MHSGISIMDTLTLAATKKALICIPAYNEEESIGTVIDKIVSLKCKEDFNILVIDDGSTDNTRAICISKNVAVISHIFNLGYGAALKTAYKYATDNDYDYLIQLDADGQHDVVNIEYIYKTLTESEFLPDIVIGSRFLENSVSFYTPVYKKFVISFFNLFIEAITRKKITDPTSGLQGLTRNAFTFYAKFNQFAKDSPDANMIIQMMLNSFTIEEIPAVMLPREHGTSMYKGIYRQFVYVVKMTLSIFITYIRESKNFKKQ